MSGLKADSPQNHQYRTSQSLPERMAAFGISDCQPERRQLGAKQPISSLSHIPFDFVSNPSIGVRVNRSR